jgi:iron complex transport system substrate-binding protein
MRFCSLILFTILLGCKPKANREEDKLLFQIEKKENYTKISTFDKSNHLLSSVVFSIIPKRIVVFSSSHAGFLNEIGVLSHVIAVSNKNYFYNPQVFENEAVQEIGDYHTVNFERLVRLKPDLLLLNTEVSPQSEFVKKLKLYKIPFLICNEYEESNVLNQSKWLRIYGAIFKKEAKADSILNFVNTEYQKSISTNPSKIITLTGLPWQNQWYVSCANSLFNNVLQDAGGKLFIEKKCDENLALSFEQILKKGRNADVWIHTGTASTYKEIEASFIYANEIKAFRSKKCFNNNARVASNLANDYWERGPVRPDLILKDLFQIYSDSTFSNGYFYKKIVE